MKLLFVTLTIAMCLAVASGTIYSVSPIPYRNITRNNPSPFYLGDDEVSPIINLGFKISVYDTEYNRVAVSTNGFMYFISKNSTYVPITSGAPTFLPSSSYSIPILSYFGADILRNAAGDVSFRNETVGYPGDREFRVYLDNQRYFSRSTYGASSITLTVIIYERDGRMEVHYTNVTPSPVSVVIGIQGPLPRNATVYNSGYLYSLSSQAIVFTPLSLCAASPCAHGGSCSENGDNIYCNCPPSYIGSRCEKVNSTFYNVSYIPYQTFTTYNTLTLGDETLTTSIPLGFTFYFYGLPYTTIRVSSNGWITFGETAVSTSYFLFNSIPSKFNPNPVIAIFAADLNPTVQGIGSSVSYYTSWMQDLFVLQFTNIALYGLSYPAVSCSLVLRKGSNTIEMHYTRVAASLPSSYKVIIGVSNRNGLLGQSFFSNGNAFQSGLNNVAIAWTPEPSFTACDGDGCDNGGVCSVSISSYGQTMNCACPWGYSGSFCQNGGGYSGCPACVNGYCSYSTSTCVCNYGWYGPTCSSTISDRPFYNTSTIAWTQFPAYVLTQTFSGSDDQVSNSIYLGFYFNFYGVSYSYIRISTNGFLIFEDPTITSSSSPSPTAPSTLPSYSTQSNIIAFWAADLNTPNGVGDYRYGTLTQNGRHRFYFQARNVSLYGNPSARVNLHVILTEITNTIEIHYTQISGQYSRTIVVGLENYGPTVAQTYLYNGTYNSEIIKSSFVFTPTSTHMCQASPCVSSQGYCYIDTCYCNPNYYGRFCQSYQPYVEPILPGHSHGLSAGVITGIVVGTVAFAVFSIAVICCCVKRRRRLMLVAHKPLQNVQVYPGAAPVVVNNNVVQQPPQYPQQQPNLVVAPVVDEYQPMYGVVVNGNGGYAPVYTADGVMPPVYEPIPAQAGAPGGPPIASAPPLYAPQVVILEEVDIAPSAPFLN